MNFCIDKLDIKRVMILIDGHFNSEKIDDLDLYNPFLVNASEDKMITLNDYEINDNTFHFEVNMMGANNNEPISTGNWSLLFIDSKGNQIGCVLDSSFEERMKQEAFNLSFYDSKPNSSYSLDILTNDDKSVLIKVDYKKDLGNKRFVNQLKNKIFNIRFYMKGMYKLAFKFFNSFVRKNGKRVLFTSASRGSLSGNQEFVYNRMKELGLDKEYTVRFNYKDGIKARRGLKDKIAFTYLLATSDIIFLDDYQPEIYTNDYDKSVKIVQLWHACGAFKTLGFERVGKVGGPPYNTRVHKCYTHMPVSSEHSIKHHAEAFALDKSVFYPIGVARTDIFFDDKYKENIIKEMHADFPQILDKNQVILYAPTFRGQNARDAEFPMDSIDYVRMGEFLKQNNSIMLLKMHPFIKEKPAIPEAYKECFLDVSDYREVNDFLFVTDLLITDYSSVIYEMSLLKKPMLFYAFDLEEYEADRGFYESYEETVPGKIVGTFDELLEALEKKDYEYEKMKGFLDKNFKYLDGKSTERLVDLIFFNKLPEENL